MGELKSIKGLVKKTIHDISLDKKMKIASIWNKHFKDYSRHTQLVDLNRGKLKIHVDSSVWMQQLNMSKKSIVSKINKHLGDKTVKDIQFIIGDINN